MAAWGAGVTVVLAALSAALINELHQGWPWWVASGAVVLLAAAVSAWLTLRARADRARDRLGAGSVKAGGDIRGSVATHVYESAPPDDAPSRRRPDRSGRGEGRS